MYTQCPDCETVFRVTADSLRAAQGDVRCGVCSASFNALENLSEEPFQPVLAAGGPAPADDAMTVEETPGAEVIELSTAAADGAGAGNPADLQPAGAEAEGEGNLEFDADPEELDRLFVEMPAVDLRGFAAGTGLPPRPATDGTNDPGAIAASLSLGGADDTGEAQPNPFEIPRIPIPIGMREGLAEEAAANAAASEAFMEARPSASPTHWPSAIAAAGLALLLVVQLLHSQRDELLRQPGIGPLLAQAYAFFGLRFAAPTDLAAYELRQWGAANDSAQPGRLLLRASIVNRADYAQPYPLLRLVLQDRFGTTIGMREIEPADYLPGTGAARLLAPGQRADAEIRIVDPGKDAVGFEMDVCLPSTGGTRCANEASAAGR